jgi:hypothetical protein
MSPIPDDPPPPAPAPSAPRPRRHRLRAAFLVVVGLIAAWGALGALFLPGFFRSRLERLVSQHTRGSLSIGRLTVNPFLLAAGIHDFVLLGPERDTLLVAKEFTLDVSITSVAMRGIALDRIALVGPQVHLTVLPDGRLDWMRLMMPSQDTTRVASAPVKPPPVRIRKLSIEDGRLFFNDLSRSVPYATELSPINLDLEKFSTVANEKGDHSFTASLVEGGTLHWQGGFSVEPVAATGRISVDSLAAHALWRWLQSDLRFELPEGRLFMSVGYAFTIAGDSTRLVLQNGSLRATGVRIVEPGRAGDVITIPALAAEGATVDFATHHAGIARVHAEGTRLVGSLSPDTTFSLAKLFAPRTPPRPPAPDAPPLDWRLTLDRFDVSGIALTFTDSTQRVPPTLDLDQIGFETHDLDSSKPLNGTISAGARFEETGTLTAEGRVSIAPTFVDLNLRAQRIPLRPVQAYLDPFIKLDIVRGNADLAGRMEMGIPENGQLTFRLRADGRVRELAAADSASGGDFLRLKDAVVKGIDMQMNPDRFRLRSVDLTRPLATVALGTDASLNLFRIFPAMVPPPPGTEVKPVPFHIESIKLRQGTMRFVDRTVTPPYVTRIDSIAGEMTNLASDSTVETRIALTGKGDGTSPIGLDARLRPMAHLPYAIFTLHLASYEMTALTPYIGKYVGRFVDRGQMSLDLDYTIENQRLKGKNNALLDQFTLGQKSGSKDATHLPVGLALALLRDRQGKIDLDIPVEGDLNDPHFGIGKVILKALLNLLTKVALSPFSLLGKLIPGGGGGDENLGTITFVAGADTLALDQVDRIGKLSTVLNERPGVKVNVTGVADSIVDRAALARRAFEMQIVRQRRAEFFDAGVAEPERAVEAPVPEGERTRALAKLYLARFGRDSLGAILPDPTLSKGDLRKIAKNAVAGHTPDKPIWPKQPIAPEFVQQMDDRLLAATVVSGADLQRLAEARGETLKRQLVEVRGLPEARVFLRGVALGGSASKDQVACPIDLSE